MNLIIQSMCRWEMTQPTLITFHPNEYNQKFNYYSLALELDRCAGICKTLIKYVFEIKQKT